MPWHTVTYKRETLYQQVCPEPTRTGPRRDGISYVGLAKICRKLGVPPLGTATVPGGPTSIFHAAESTRSDPVSPSRKLHRPVSPGVVR